MAKKTFENLDLIRQGFDIRRARIENMFPWGVRSLSINPMTDPSRLAGNLGALSIPKHVKAFIGDPLLLQFATDRNILPENMEDIKGMYKALWDKRGLYPQGTSAVVIDSARASSNDIIRRGLPTTTTPEVLERVRNQTVYRPGPGRQQYLPFPGETQYAGHVRTPPTPAGAPLTSTARQAMATQAQMTLPFPRTDPLGPSPLPMMGSNRPGGRAGGRIPIPGSGAMQGPPRGPFAPLTVGGSPPPLGPPRPPGLPAGLDRVGGPATSPLGPARGGRLGPPRPPGLPAGGAGGAGGAAADKIKPNMLKWLGGHALKTGLPVAMIAMMWHDILSRPKKEQEEAFIDHITTTQGLGNTVDFQSMRARETSDNLGLTAAIGRLPGDESTDLNKLMKDSIPLFQMSSLAAQSMPPRSTMDVDLARQVGGI